MNILEWFKNIFNKKNKVLLLDNSTHQEQINNLDFIPKVEHHYYIPKQGTLDFAIDQYLKNIVAKLETNQYADSYSTLVNICGMNSTDPFEINKNAESRLIEKLQKNPNTKIILQSHPPEFCHVHNTNASFEINKRLYLNCKRENIANLTDKLLDSLNNKNIPYKMKFRTDYSYSKYNRSESIVFYIENDAQIQEYAQVIEEVKQQSPHLFENTEKVNPFLKTVNGYIAYAPEPKTNTYTCINGSETHSNKSYNSLLSVALEDSLKCALKSIATTNSHFQDQVSPDDFINPNIYLKKYLPFMLSNEDYRKILLVTMKTNLRISSINNPTLDILGIETQEKSREEN